MFGQGLSCHLNTSACTYCCRPICCCKDYIFVVGLQGKRSARWPQLGYSCTLLSPFATMQNSHQQWIQTSQLLRFANAKFHGTIIRFIKNIHVAHCSVSKDSCHSSTCHLCLYCLCTNSQSWCYPNREPNSKIMFMTCFALLECS